MDREVNTVSEIEINDKGKVERKPRTPVITSKESYISSLNRFEGSIRPELENFLVPVAEFTKDLKIVRYFPLCGSNSESEDVSVLKLVQ